MLFFLLEKGVPYEHIYGFHDGLDFQSLVSLFLYHKRREIENQRDRALEVAIGASALFSQKGFKNFEREIQSALQSLSVLQKKDAEAEAVREDAAKVVRDLHSVLGF